jgi:hypothetical protein
MKSSWVRSSTDGNWDFLDQYWSQEIQRLKRNWTDASGTALDELEGLTRIGSSVPFAGSVSEAGEKFTRMTAEIDALDYFAKTGKIPNARSYSSAGNPFDLIQKALESSEKFDQTILERGFDVQSFLTKGSIAEEKGYIETIQEALTAEEEHYRDYFAQQEAAEAVPEKNIVSGRKNINQIINSEFDDIVDLSPTIPDDSYLASLMDTPDYMVDDVGDFFDDSFEYIDEVNPFDIDSTSTSGPQKLQALNTVVDDLTTGGPPTAGKKVMFPQLTAKVKSVIDQSIDLAIDVSNDISKGASAGSSVVSSAKSGASTAARAAKNTNTAQGIIGSMNEARNIVSGLSTAKKTGITLGALGTIGALSSSRRDKRRN